ncbi:hypothetical protein [Novipirellula artificiosorum]|uniref:Uncharacterized protein n=1 Tax=Novipirellula artificiosorum TaxID=2528016 RepID=A0A5C6E2Y3_9BACT|nr:hypothetical protein [Novipirellula artificiosorum]TWU41746.1 hypothetical protein Poly41_00380 [Novipirellula artificiosorum]
MLRKLTNSFAAFCVATVLTQMMLVGFFLFRGTINGNTGTKVVALLNGIDITGNRLQQILQQSEDIEQPDFEEILQARKMESLEMDMRLRSQNEYRDELSTKEAALREEQAFFDERREAFTEKLKKMEQGARDKGVQEVQRTLQALDAVQAKEQLLRIYDDERIDEVVNIIQAMAIEKRKDILAEFATPAEADKLAEILRRIGEGYPTTALINQAGGG